MVGSPRPGEPLFTDEANVRSDLTIGFDLILDRVDRSDFCPMTQDLADRVSTAAGAGDLTPAEQDLVVDQCLGCGRCRTEPADVDDLPELIIRARAMQRARGHLPRSRRLAARLLAGRDARGWFGRLLSPLVDRFLAAAPQGTSRRLLQRVSGISDEPVLLAGHPERFSSWWPRWQASRGLAPLAGPGTLAIMPTCVLEYREPSIGRDLVAIIEHQGRDAVLATSRCCGRGLLESGDVGAFINQAHRVLGDLAPLADAGCSIVVPDAECLGVVESYPRWVPGDEATAVASAALGVASALMPRLQIPPQQATETRRATLHLPCHRPASDHQGRAEQQLLEVLGFEVSVVEGCAGIGGNWGLLADHRRTAQVMAEAVVAGIDTTGAGPGSVVVGTCASANRALSAAGAASVHPVQLVARVLGVADERPTD